MPLTIVRNDITKMQVDAIVFKVIKLSRNTANEEFSFVAIGCGHTNVGEKNCHYIPPIVMPSDKSLSSNSSWLSI